MQLPTLEKAYESDLVARFMELIKPLTPYVYKEARWRMFDLAVYFPEPAVDKRFRIQVMPSEKDCSLFARREGKGVCRNKVDEFYNRYDRMWRYELYPNHSKDEDRYDAFYVEKATEKILTKKEFLKLKEENEDKTLCKWKGCKYLAKIIGWRVKRFRDFKQGLYLFEFKSDHDNIKRYIDQLPNYLMFADYHYLVIGEKQKIPEWLPSFVGVYRYDEKEKVFTRESQGTYIKRTFQFHQGMMSKEFPGLLNASSQTAFQILQDWLINSIFYWKYNRLVKPMDGIEDILKMRSRTHKEKETKISTTLEDFTKPND